MTPPAKRKRMGFSGGKDSTAMGERLFEMGEEFDLIFTPTGNELPGVFDHIYEMSERWKAPLIIPKGPKLEELILGTDTIPNFRQRWCTPGIKILPCLHWLKSHPDTVLCVGLRADEEERQGIYGMVVEYRFPLREWGWGIQEVWGYLKQRGIKIPKRTDCAWCVTGDTRVWVRGEGLCSIETLVGRESVTVWSGKEWRETKAVCNGIKPVSVLETSWGTTIRATSDHEILTRRGRVQLKDLRIGDALLWEPSPESPFPAQANLPPLPARLPHPNARNVVTGTMPVRWSRDVGLFLGYVVGDGSANLEDPYPTIRVIASRDDRGDLEHLRDLVASWCSTQADVCDSTGTPNELCPNGTGPRSQIAWRVQILADFLRSLGLDKSPNPSLRRVPDAIWGASEEGVCGFLSGLFSTDGCVSMAHGGRVHELSLASVSHRMLQEVQVLLFALGVRSSVCPYRDGREERGHHTLWKLSIGGVEGMRYFADRIRFLTRRKQDALERGLALFPVKGRLRVPTVVSITKAVVQVPVYDLVNVGNEHQFVANGVSISNCYDQRIEEWYNLWLEFPDIFQRGVELEERVGHTFRSAQRDTWPAPLKELRREFERGRKPRGLRVVQDSPSGCGAEEDGRDKACRICRI